MLFFVVSSYISSPAKKKFFSVLPNCKPNPQDKDTQRLKKFFCFSYSFVCSKTIFFYKYIHLSIYDNIKKEKKM